MINNIKIVQEFKRNGQSVSVYELTCADGTTAIISNYGCILSKLCVKDIEGEFRDVLLGFDDVEEYFGEDYLNGYPYFGAVIGRYANRIKGAHFKIDGKEFNLSKNVNNNTLHGGKEGFDKKIWEPLLLVCDPHPSITMQYISVDGEEGFPGELKTKFTFTLFPNAFEYKFECTSNKATAVNLTYHPYFNLDTNHENLGEQKVKINSDFWLQQDADFCTTGVLVPVVNSAYDFRIWKPTIQKWNVADGYDQSFVIDKSFSEFLPAAEAQSSDGLLQLKVFTTEQVVHFYTGKYIPSVKGKDGVVYGPFCGFCFETHGYPNAVNIIDFPNSILQPGTKKVQTTLYKF